YNQYQSIAQEYCAFLIPLIEQILNHKSKFEKMTNE
ncbi:hypothetical protein SNEBB_007258, partial [Seison nebaliae]